MGAGTLLFRASVLFFALALVVFVTVVALNAGESSAKLNCNPSTQTCTGGGAFNDGTGGGGGRTTGESRIGGEGFGNQEDTYQGLGGNLSCNIETGDCTNSGGGRHLNPEENFGGRCEFNVNDPNNADCTPNAQQPG